MNLIKHQPEFFDTDLFDLPGRVLRSPFFRDAGFPMVNIRNLDKEFTVDLAVPGYRKEDLKIEVADGILTVRSEQKTEKESGQDGWKRREFTYNSFERSFQLPENADADNVQASYKDGVLHLAIAKKANAEVTRSRAVAIK